jgi:hypothetical protein
VVTTLTLPELVGPVRLALANALHFGGVQGIDLAALVAVLIAHAAGQAHGPGEDILQGIVALDPAADVTDDPAQIGPELAQSLVGAFELVGVGVALVLDQRELADPRIALA